METVRAGCWGFAHGDGFITIFGHLEATGIRAGRNVERGQTIGSVGATGWSVAPNLHYGVLKRRRDGSYRYVDPRIHILDYGWDNEQAHRLRGSWRRRRLFRRFRRPF